MTVYATPEDLYAEQGKLIPPAGIPAAVRAELLADLRSASDDVKFYTRLSGLRWHPNGFPAAPVHAEAVKRATCAQAEWYGITKDRTGAESRFDSVSRSNSRADVTISETKSRRAGAAGEGSSPAGSRIAPRALIILDNAGIRPSNARRG